MARTLNGQLTGKAAQIQKAEERADSLLRGPERLAPDVMEKYQKQLREMMLACIAIEGEAFVNWWDDDSNVPAVCDIRKQTYIAGEHLATLRRRQRVQMPVAVSLGVSA